MKLIIVILSISCCIIFAQPKLNLSGNKEYNTLFVYDSTDVNENKPEEKKWGLSIGFGNTFISKPEGIEAQMRKSGLNEKTIPFFNEGIQTPSTKTKKGGFNLEIHYNINPALQFGVIYGYSNLASVWGVKSILTSFTIEYTMKTFAAMAWIKSESLRLGAGTGIFITNVTASGNPEKNFYKPGLLLEAQLNIPQSSRFYFSLLLQYKLIAPVTIGPYRVLSTYDNFTFPEVELSLTHFYYGIGVGVRFE